MDTLERLRRVRQSHDYCNRMPAAALASAACTVGFAPWCASAPLLDEYELGVGDDQGRALMASDWRRYRCRISGIRAGFGGFGGLAL